MSSSRDDVGVVHLMLPLVILCLQIYIVWTHCKYHALSYSMFTLYSVSWLIQILLIRIFHCISNSKSSSVNFFPKHFFSFMLHFLLCLHIQVQFTEFEFHTIHCDICQDGNQWSPEYTTKRPLGKTSLFCLSWARQQLAQILPAIGLSLFHK